jgi:hypothetical protein
VTVFLRHDRTKAKACLHTLDRRESILEDGCKQQVNLHTFLSLKRNVLFTGCREQSQVHTMSNTRHTGSFPAFARGSRRSVSPPAIATRRFHQTRVPFVLPLLPTILCLHAMFAQDPPPAFPGAEGFGATASGGRGGRVIHVTNLNPSGQGSLQWALDEPGPRYVLFRTSGHIPARIHLRRGDVTIAGETSPGGITVRGWITDEVPYQDQDERAPRSHTENWILRNIRIRPVDPALSDDGLRLRYTRRAIIDHVSIGNAFDEAVEISYSSDLTVQYCHIAETLGSHANYGGMLINYSNPSGGFPLDRISIHHNLFNRIEGRLPEVSRESPGAAHSTMDLEISCNLYWDPDFFIVIASDTGNFSSGGGPLPAYYRLNAVNNRMVTRHSFPYGMWDDPLLRSGTSARGNQLHVSGNRIDRYPELADYQLFYCCNDFELHGQDVPTNLATILPSRHAFPPVRYTDTGILTQWLGTHAGAFPRDPMDERLLKPVLSGGIDPTSRRINPANDALLAPVGAQPPNDSDGDGMPDAWEITRGLDPHVHAPNSTTLSSSGYTNLEVYLHEQASRLTGTGAQTPHPANPLPQADLRLHRFLRLDSHSHFFTASEEERHWIATRFSSAIWRYEGVSHLVFSASTAPLKPVYRIYQPRLNSHYYTLDEEEIARMKLAPGGDAIIVEGVAFHALSAPYGNARPVHRFHVARTRSWFFTISEAEKTWIENHIPPERFQYQGIAWWAF